MADIENNGAVPAEPENKPEQVTIHFTDAAGNACAFKHKRSTKLKKAMDHYAARQQRDVNTFRFLLDGQRVLEDQTPDDLEMEDGDKIEAYTEQIGGGH